MFCLAGEHVGLYEIVLCEKCFWCEIKREFLRLDSWGWRFNCVTFPSIRRCPRISKPYLMCITKFKFSPKLKLKESIDDTIRPCLISFDEGREAANWQYSFTARNIPGEWKCLHVAWGIYFIKSKPIKTYLTAGLDCWPRHWTLTWDYNQAKEDLVISTYLDL